MKKKLGISIIVGVIILSCILGVVSIAYTTFNNVYAADTREDFSFAKENGKVKTYEFPLEENFGFNMILPDGVSKKDVKFSEKNNADLLEVKTGSDGVQSVTGIKLGRGTLVATITVDGKEYEATTSFQVVERDFSFPVVNKVVKQYVGKDAFVVGEETKFKMNLPSGYTLDDVEFYEEGNQGLLEINDIDKSVIAKKEGTGVLFAHIKDTNTYASVNFEVVSDEKSSNSSKENNNNSTNNNSNTTANNNNTSSSKTNCSIKFQQEQRIVTYTGKSMRIYESPVTSGIKSGSVEWSSSDTSIADVASNGKNNQAEVVIKKAGKVTITASYPTGGVSATKEIIIHSDDLEVIDSSKNDEITDTTVTLNVGDTLNISMREEGQDIDNGSVKYTSTNGKVCSIDENGNIKALAKGTTTIKGMLAENNKSNGQIRIQVSGDQEEAMQKGTFSFPIDPETNKIKEYKGKYAFVVGESYTFDMVKPEGAEDYPVDFSCSKKDIMEVNEDGSIRFVGTGSGTLTAKIKIGNKTKTAKTKFEVVATMAEKEQAGGTEVQYINISFDQESMVIEEGNSFTLKPTIDTNIPKKDYELVWSVSQEGYVEINKNGRVTPLKPGKVDVTVSVKDREDATATITLDIQEDVTLVASLKFISDIPKKSNTYLLTTNEPYTMEFSVLPTDASLSDYTIEVEDTENFIVDGKNVIALTPGVKTKLTARALDSGGKSTTINIESVISDSELASLQSILENNEITVKIGETLRFRNVENVSKRATVTRSGSNFILDYDEDLVTITGKKLGDGKITVKFNDQKVEIPVKVVQDTQEEDITNPVKEIVFPVDPNTAQTVDYVNDSPLQVGTYYNVGVSVLPESVTNKDVVFSVSDTDAYTVTSEGSIVANEPNKTATLTVTSVSNPEVSSSIRIASTDAEIASISFAKDRYELNTEHDWGFNLIINLTSGRSFNPVTEPDIVNNTEYQRLLRQIVITSSNESLVKIINNGASVVKGVNGSGTLTAYVANNPSIRCSVGFDSIGIDEDEQIREVKFAKSTYNISTSDGGVQFYPIIKLTSGKTLDPSKDWDQPNGVATTQEYKNYLSQLKLVNVSGVKSGTYATEQLVVIVNSNNQLAIEARYAGECELGIALKSDNKVIAKTKLVITDETVSSGSGVTGVVEEIDHATTTTNRNLNITNVQFDKNSYKLTGNFSYGFQPIIRLSDGTELSQNSEDQDTYKYYIGLTDFYLVNDSSTSTIDFGVVQILNDEAPKALVPLKNGKVILAVGSKSTGMTYDTVPVTVELQ